MAFFVCAGGALKPTTTENLWIHVTCAWFMEEVTFTDATVMEPADGVTCIPLARFREVSFSDIRTKTTRKKQIK